MLLAVLIVINYFLMCLNECLFLLSDLLSDVIQLLLNLQLSIRLYLLVVLALCCVIIRHKEIASKHWVRGKISYFPLSRGGTSHVSEEIIFGIVIPIYFRISQAAMRIRIKFFLSELFGGVIVGGGVLLLFIELIVLEVLIDGWAVSLDVEGG